MTRIFSSERRVTDAAGRRDQSLRVCSLEDLLAEDLLADDLLAEDLLAEDLLAEDVGVPAVLRQLAQYMEVDPPKGEWATAIAANDVIQAQV
jgi:hypothetical protein